MGSSNSTQAVTSLSCHGCGGSRQHIVPVDQALVACQRCGTYLDPHAFNPKKKKTSVAISSSNNNSSNNSIQGYHPIAIHQSSAADEKSAGVTFDENTPLAPLRYLHIAPFRESLPEDALLLSEDELKQRFIQDFFQNNILRASIGCRYNIGAVSWKVVGCHPPIGISTKDTIIRIEPHISIQARVAKVQIMPTAASLAVVESKKLFQDHIRPYFAEHQRHISIGETFVSKGLQFSVVACEPTNGLVTTATQIYPGGADDALVDLDSLNILPIFESLPNREKNITEEEIKKRYLEPFFFGRFRLIHRGQDLRIDGVDFKVRSCDPERGIVTLTSVITANGVPLRADDLARQQMEDDEALARRLQQQEQGGPMLVLPRPNAVAAGDLRREDLPPRFQELQQAIQALPANDPRRIILSQIFNHISMMPIQNRGLILPAGVNLNGASSAEIESLPTREFQGLDPSKAESKVKEHFTCMVCLMEYEKGDSLRTLPCFHSYHKDCIDKWLVRNKKCPICKNPIG